MTRKKNWNDKKKIVWNRIELNKKYTVKNRFDERTKIIKRG